MPFWAGYSMAARDVTGVRTDWVEPSVAGAVLSGEYLWVGIGSWDSASVVQAGTYVIFPNADTESRGAWFERYPRDPQGITGNLSENVGDTIAASVISLPGVGHRWLITVRDVTTKTFWSKTVSYSIAHDDADFIVEDPTMNAAGKLAPFALWGSVKFSNMAVRIGQRWLPAGALRSLRFDMVRHGRTVATVGPLQAGGTSFVARQRIPR
jgi:hypothetical protein